MGFYVIFILFLAIFFANYNVGGVKKPIVLTYVGVIFFCLVLSLRYDVGWDYEMYFTTLYPYPKEWYLELAEPVYKLFCYIVIHTGLPVYTLFILFGVVTCYFLFKSLFDYTDNVFIGLLVYMAFYFETSFGFMRQGLALVIILYAYKYLVGRNWMKYFLFCGLAICSHYSAVVSLFFPLIYGFCNSFKKTLFLMLSVYVILKVAMIVIFSMLHLYEHYVLDDVTIGGGSMIRIMNIGIILAMIALAKYKRASNTNLRLLYIALIGCCFPFIFGGHLGGRLAWYFLIYLCIAIPNILEFKPNRVFNRLCEVGLMGIFLLLIYVSSGNPIKSPYTPYQTILTTDLKHPHFK